MPRSGPDYFVTDFHVHRLAALDQVPSSLSKLSKLHSHHCEMFRDDAVVCTSSEPGNDRGVPIVNVSLAASNPINSASPLTIEKFSSALIPIASERYVVLLELNSQCSNIEETCGLPVELDFRDPELSVVRQTHDGPTCPDEAACYANQQVESVPH
eukprot:GHVQ01010750.1.p1 GENE.GHVQ01010750.1~~GHVQ01010750.1.p1  ORF type:complete len:156 (-),score=15.97 GHVQ01010750.1:165-632(-)